MALAALESYLIRRFVVVPNAGKNYNNLVVGILKAIGTASQPLNEPILKLIGYLSESDDKTRIWPSRRSVCRPAFDTEVLPGILTQEGRVSPPCH